MGGNDHRYLYGCSSDCLDVLITSTAVTCRNSNCACLLQDWNCLIFLRVKKKTFPRFLVLADFIACFPPEIPHDITFIPSIEKSRQRWRVSWIRSIGSQVRVCLHGGVGPLKGEVTCGGSPHISCKSKCDQIKMRDYMERWVTPAKWVTSPTWGPSTPCKQALIDCSVSSVGVQTPAGPTLSVFK